MLDLSRNPLTDDQTARVVELADLQAATILTRPRRSAKRRLFDMRRTQTAAAAIEPLTKSNELYGFTKGQFSVLDLITACLARTGPADFVISTWTAARKEILDLDALKQAGSITSARWLVDYTFVRRDRAALHQIRQTFGHGALRIANTHSKFCLFGNAEWKLVLRSSMNLNMNPRFEDFTLANDPAIYRFLETIIDEIWTKQRTGLADTAAPGEFLRFFNAKM